MNPDSKPPDGKSRDRKALLMPCRSFSKGILHYGARTEKVFRALTSIVERVAGGILIPYSGDDFFAVDINWNRQERSMATSMHLSSCRYRPNERELQYSTGVPKYRLSLKNIETFNTRAIHECGPRYSININPDSPNLQVEELNREFDVLSLATGWESELTILENDLRNSLQDFEKKNTFFTKLDFARMRAVYSQLSTLRLCSITNMNAEYLKLLRAIRTLENRVTRIEAKLEKQRSLVDKTGAGAEEMLRKLERSLSRVSAIRRRLYQLTSYLVDGPGRFLGDSQILFLEGPWGSGKTHYLCEFSISSGKDKTSTIFVTAPGIENAKDPLSSLINSLDLSCSVENFLSQLNNFGAKSGKRFVLIIDSINEGDLQDWISWLQTFSGQIHRFPHIGLVVSCRTDSVQIRFHPRSAKRIRRVDHPGFDGIEFEAQTKFFEFYEIDSRGIPLLTPEFSTPLVLKMICESVKRFKPDKRNRKFREITSGQKGVTYILECFAKDLGATIESKYGLPRKYCWWFLKGKQRSSLDIGLAGRMAEEERLWLSEEEIYQLMRATPGFVIGIEKRLKLSMLKEGLLIAISRYDFSTGTYYNVYSFSYQRFGEHLIARYLMGKYLKVGTEEDLERSLMPGSKLGKLFDSDDNSSGFQFSNLGSAVMTDFPERMANRFSRKEVISFLPENKRNPHYLKDIFLESLSWRAINETNFSRETLGYISYYLNSDIDRFRDETFESLLSLSIRRNSNILTEFLKKFLSAISMVERDLIWSEYLRRSYPSASIYRLLSWFENGFPDIGFQDVEEGHLVILGFTLSSTTVRLRDRATRALYIAGRANPELLFSEFLEFLKLKDLYICERYLAAIYGVYLATWTKAGESGTWLALVEFAKRLLAEFAADDSLLRFSHSLIEDYVLGIIEYGFKIAPHEFSQSDVGFALVPGGALLLPKPSVQGIKSARSSALVKRFFGDFYNYTVGRLVQGRTNYDDDDPVYQKYLDYISKRILKLGFKMESFEEIDRGIAQHTFSEKYIGKTERYLKKYSRIAYFELRGWLRSRGKIEREYVWEREPESELDPSFPQNAPYFAIPFQVPRKDRFLDPISWLNEGCSPRLGKFFKLEFRSDGISSQWLLLDASVERLLPNQRRIHFRVHSYLGTAHTLSDTDSRLKLIEYLGDWDAELRQTPENLFAAEIPSSKYFNLSGTEVIEDFTFTPHRFEMRNGLREEDLDLFHSSVSWTAHGNLLDSLRTTFVVSPSPILSGGLGLRNAPDTHDLYTEDGVCMSKFFDEESPSGRSSGHSLWVRKDALDKFLSDNEMELIYRLRGERDFTLRDGEYGYKDELLEALRSTRANGFFATHRYDLPSQMLKRL